MKNKILIIFLSLILLATICMTAFFYRRNVNEKKAQRKNFQKQLGTYVLDLNRTKLGAYEKDSLLYEDLRITFNNDSTFHLNMTVPFIYDSTGKWIASGNGLEDWNRLYYRKWPYSIYDKNSGTQFTQTWTKDSIFYINGATPQTGFQFIQEIYFKKIK